MKSKQTLNKRYYNSQSDVKKKTLIKEPMKTQGESNQTA